jgi:hypothetical protein
MNKRAIVLLSSTYGAYCYTVYPLNAPISKYIPSYTTFKKSRVESSKESLKSYVKEIGGEDGKNSEIPEVIFCSFLLNRVYDGEKLGDTLLSIVDSISEDDYSVWDVFQSKTSLMVRTKFILKTKTDDFIKKN